jgi:LysM repeat protein
MRLYRFGLVLVLIIIASVSFGAASGQGNTSPVLQPCTVAQPSGWVEYSIVSGDTLSDIAANTGSTVDELARVNCIVDVRRIVAGQRLFVPHLPDPIHHFLRRCLNAGFTMQECRRIYNDLYGSDQENFLRRCLNAGYTEQQCRRIYNALLGDDSNLAERCRLAGLTPEECRRLVNASAEPDLAERCRRAGLTAEQCRRLVNAGRDPADEAPQVDPVRPVDVNTSEGNPDRGTRP